MSKVAPYLRLRFKRSRNSRLVDISRYSQDKSNRVGPRNRRGLWLGSQTSQLETFGPRNKLMHITFNVEPVGLGISYPPTTLYETKFV